MLAFKQLGIRVSKKMYSKSLFFLVKWLPIEHPGWTSYSQGLLGTSAVILAQCRQFDQQWKYEHIRHFFTPNAAISPSSFGRISAQPHTLTMHTFCDSNSIRARHFWKRVSFNSSGRCMLSNFNELGCAGNLSLHFIGSSIRGGAAPRSKPFPLVSYLFD